MVAKDTTCDSVFMKGAMRRIGVALRVKYHWVDFSTPIFLVLDNAGGHGTNQCIGEYVTMLKDEYNVICIHQVPRSPFNSVLDLGVWATL